MKPNTTQPRWAVIQAFQHQQSMKVQSQNFPPPGWVYYPITRVEPRAGRLIDCGDYEPPKPPDVAFPNHMRYGFTEREPQMFVHRTALVGLSVLTALFVIEFGWWISQ